MRTYFIFLTLLYTTAFWAQSHKQLIQNELDTHKSTGHLTASDISDWTLDSEVFAQGTQITSCYLVQNYQGIRVYNSSSTASIKGNKVVQLALNFTDHLRDKINTTQPQLSVEQGFLAACQQLQIAQTPRVTVLEQLPHHRYRLADGLQDDPIACQLVFESMPNQRLVLAWYFQFYSPDAKHLWDVRVDASNGTILAQNDLTVSCAFGSAHATQGAKQYNFSQAASMPKSLAPYAPTPGTYRAVPIRYESPNHHPFELD